MYSVNWVFNGQFISHHTNSWSEAYDLYVKMRDTRGVNDVRITDMEYGVDFKNGRWERDSNLCGWAGGEN